MNVNTENIPQNQLKKFTKFFEEQKEKKGPAVNKAISDIGSFLGIGKGNDDGVVDDISDFYKDDVKPVLQDVGTGIGSFFTETIPGIFQKKDKSKTGGQLKPVPSGKKGKGLRKLPRQVRNKMGYMEYGGPKGEEAYLARKDAAIKAAMAKQGDDLPKAQTSIPENFFSNFTTDFQRDTQAVEDSFLQDRFPDLGPTPLEQENQNFLSYLANLNKADDNEPAEVDPVDAAASQVDPIDITVKPDRSLKGMASDIYNSNLMKGFEAVGAAAVVGAGLAKDLFGQDEQEEGYISGRESTIADNSIAIEANPFSRGKGAQVQGGRPGGFGSEDDQITGLFMNQGDNRELLVKKGGSFNNEGFKSLPPAVQAKIKKNSKKKMGGENIVNVDPAMLAKLIAAGADIEML